MVCDLLRRGRIGLALESLFRFCSTFNISSSERILSHIWKSVTLSCVIYINYDNGDGNDYDDMMMLMMMVMIIVMTMLERSTLVTLPWIDIMGVTPVLCTHLRRNLNDFFVSETLLSSLPNGNHVDCLLVLLVCLLHVGDAGLVEILDSVLKEHRSAFDEVGNHAGVSPGQLHTKVRSNT